MRNITPMTGIAAIFVRNFMEAYLKGETKLFDCQAAGKVAVIEAGSKLSDTYLSTLSRKMVADGLYVKYKVGRNWALQDGDNTEAFAEFLEEHDDWGLMLQGTVQDLKDKATIFQEL